MNTLIQRAKVETTPLIDGDTLTFIFEAEKMPYLKGDFSNWTPVEMIADADGLWVYSVEGIDSRAHIEYCYMQAPDDEDTRLADPFNPRRITNGHDAFNHYVEMPNSLHTPLTRYPFGIKKGQVTRHFMEHPAWLIGGKRDVWLYQPPVEKPVPLLVCYDGKDYYERAKLTVIVDNLIAQDTIRPIAIAMVENAKDARFLEYHQSETLLFWLMNELLPFANKHLNLLDIKQHTGAYGVLGASMSGLMALHTGLRLPHVFGKVISQSGAYFSQEYAGNETLIEFWIKNLPIASIEIWQDVGMYDFLLEWNRQMHALLEEKGYNHSYYEYPAGHNYIGWRDSLPAALVALFGKEK